MSWITDGSTGPPVGGAPEVACTFILLFHEKYLTGRAYPKDAAEGKPLGDRALLPTAERTSQLQCTSGEPRALGTAHANLFDGQILLVARRAGMRLGSGH